MNAEGGWLLPPVGCGVFTATPTLFVAIRLHDSVRQVLNIPSHTER
jgi:hypothetical protein